MADAQSVIVLANGNRLQVASDGAGALASKIRQRGFVAVIDIKDQEHWVNTDQIVEITGPLAESSVYLT